MKFLIAVVLLATCVAAQGLKFRAGYTTIIPLKEYYTQNPWLTKIISGQLATLGQFPYQAALFMYYSNGGGAFCGGSLISQRWILTAAHCASGVSYWDIKLGGIRNDINEAGQVVLRSSRGIVHPNYNSYLNNDIALIELPQDVTLSSQIQLSRLPSKSEANDALLNVRATVSGWGKTSDASGGASNKLYYVQIDTISNADCARYYGSQTVIASTLCCKGRPEHSPCSGDSGGPLVRTASDGRLTQIGVVSFVSSAGCASGNPSGFVRTASFLDWINQNTGIAIRP